MAEIDPRVLEMRQQYEEEAEKKRIANQREAEAQLNKKLLLILAIFIGPIVLVLIAALAAK